MQISFLAGLIFLTLISAHVKSQDKGEHSIKIGILIPEKNSVGAIRGADMAVRAANDAGGLNGRPFKLVIRSLEGPWGTGSKQAVNLIFEEKVWALFGSHDGRNAHLVEQAATKSTVVFLSSWSGDPTLSQAFVPWFFNCVPTDYQQSEALFEDIYIKNKAHKVVVVSENTYDSETALSNFQRIVKKENVQTPVHYVYDDYSGRADILADQIMQEKPMCIVLLCQPASALKLTRQLNQKQSNQILYGLLFLLNEDMLPHDEVNYLYDRLNIPVGIWSESRYLEFRSTFQDLYNEPPGMVSTYAYDGMSVLIEAIKKAASPDRELIQKALETTNYEGVTGLIRFDDKGNRTGNFRTIMINNDLPEIMK